MSSSSDILDVLNIRTHSPAESSNPKKKQKVGPTRKLDGLQRELYSLLGESTPPINISRNKFKERLKLVHKPSPWVWKEFTNKARKDDLVFHHWVQDKAGANEETSFEKYNKSLEIPDFTEDEYKQFLVDSDWSYEETRYLFDICSDFDLRWIIIFDRYNFKPTDSSTVKQIRTMEGLKDRFYTVCRKILDSKHQDQKPWSPHDQELRKGLEFNKEREESRKKYLERLLARTPSEIAEEESLLIEASKFEAASKKTLAERAFLLRLLDSPQINGPYSQYTTSQGIAQLCSNLMATDKSKRKKTGEVVLGRGVPTSSRSRSSTPSGSVRANNRSESRKVSAAASSPAAALIAKKLTPEEEAAYGIVYHEKLAPGVYLRSSKITTFKHTVQTKVNNILAEIDIPTRPIMPTRRVCAKFETLLKVTTVLLEAKRQADKLEAELKVLRSQN